MSKHFAVCFFMCAAVMLLSVSAYGVPSQQSPSKKAEAQSNQEEIEVLGEILSDKLKGNLQAGFDAYLKGDFKLAEYKFSSALKEEQNAELLDTQNLKIFGDDLLSNANRPIFSYLTLVERKRLSAIYYMRGIAQARQGKADVAKVSMRKAIKVNANNIDARVDYSLLELQSGNKRDAEKQMKKIKKLLKKCKNESAGDCENLRERFAQLQTVFAQTSVN